jgi:hypothetical protein
MGEPEGISVTRGMTRPGGTCAWCPCARATRVAAAMVILTDVTEKRVLEAHAIRNARLASLGVLAASVAHEINNPNNAIHFNASILARSWEDHPQGVRPAIAGNTATSAIGGMPVDQAPSRKACRGSWKGSSRAPSGSRRSWATSSTWPGRTPETWTMPWTWARSCPPPSPFSKARSIATHDHCRLLNCRRPCPTGARQWPATGTGLYQPDPQCPPIPALIATAAVLISAGLEPEGEFVRVTRRG